MLVIFVILVDQFNNMTEMLGSTCHEWSVPYDLLDIIVTNLAKLTLLIHLQVRGAACCSLKMFEMHSETQP